MMILRPVDGVAAVHARTFSQKTSAKCKARHDIVRLPHAVDYRGVVAHRWTSVAPPLLNRGECLELSFQDHPQALSSAYESALSSIAHPGTLW
jgi:hypothetical protein